MEWSVQQIARDRRHHQPDAAPLRRHRAAETQPHRRQRLPVLRRGRARAAAAHPAPAGPRARAPGDRRGPRPRAGCRPQALGRPPRVAAAGTGPAGAADRVGRADASKHWKKEDDSWRRRCSTASTTPSTRTRSRSAGARTRTRQSDAWWRGMGAAEKDAWKQRSRQLGSDWIAAAESGVAADSDEAQELAQRHVEWLTGIPGTPGRRRRQRRPEGLRPRPRRDVRGRPRFAANYGGAGRGRVRARRPADLRREAPLGPHLRAAPRTGPGPAAAGTKLVR